MEEYLQNVKKWRSQMNDAEDLAAKISLDEQNQIKAVNAMEKELELAKSEEERLKEVMEKSIKEKDQTRSQILHNLSRIESLKSDCVILCQAIELIQNERASLVVKHKAKRASHTEVAGDMRAKLQEQLDWINTNNSCIEAEKLDEADDKVNECPNEIGARYPAGFLLNTDVQGHAKYNDYNDLIAKSKSAKVKLDEITENKSKLEVEIDKMQQSIDQLQSQLDGFPPELKAMDIKHMEEEQKALLSDKAGETEYLQTLGRQIEQLKGISHVVKCTCGVEYKISMETSGLKGEKP